MQNACEYHHRGSCHECLLPPSRRLSIVEKQPSRRTQQQQCMALCVTTWSRCRRDGRDTESDSVEAFPLCRQHLQQHGDALRAMLKELRKGWKEQRIPSLTHRDVAMMLSGGRPVHSGPRLLWSPRVWSVVYSFPVAFSVSSPSALVQLACLQHVPPGRVPVRLPSTLVLSRSVEELVHSYGVVVSDEDDRVQLRRRLWETLELQRGGVGKRWFTFARAFADRRVWVPLLMSARSS